MLPTRPSRSPLRVLVIDDDRLTGDRLLRGLAPTFDVELETDALDALTRLLDASCYDVVLCDMQMSLFSGPEILSILRREGIPLAERFVFMSDAGALHARSGEQTLGRPVLRKPLSMVQLHVVLRGVAVQGQAWSRAAALEQTHAG